MSEGKTGFKHFLDKENDGEIPKLEKVKEKVKEENKKIEKKIKKADDNTAKLSVRDFLSTSQFVREFNPYLKAGFERWLYEHDKEKIISRLSKQEWEEVYKRYTLFAV